MMVRKHRRKGRQADQVAPARDDAFPLAQPLGDLDRVALADPGGHGPPLEGFSPDLDEDHRHPSIVDEGGNGHGESRLGRSRFENHVDGHAEAQLAVLVRGEVNQRQAPVLVDLEAEVHLL